MVSAGDAEPPEEGWYRDPYGLHHDRWISGGMPTDLVRDDGLEAKDPPPDQEPARPMTPSPSGPTTNSDTARADAAAGDVDRVNYTDRAFEAEGWSTVPVDPGWLARKLRRSR